MISKRLFQEKKRKMIGLFPSIRKEIQLISPEEERAIKMISKEVQGQEAILCDQLIQ